MSRKISLIIIVVFVLFFLSCGKTPTTHFYLIDYPITQQSANSSPAFEISIGVAKFSVDPLYSDGRLVYRENPYEGNYYFYHRWITDPGKMITEKVIEQLNGSGLFSQVVPFPRFSQCEYILNGNVKAIEEWDEKNLWSAKVKIEYELSDNKTRDLLWRRIIEQQNPVSQKTPFDLVTAINTCVRQNVEELQQVLNDYFSHKN